jgi:hypothetical protein
MSCAAIGRERLEAHGRSCYARIGRARDDQPGEIAAGGRAVRLKWNGPGYRYVDRHQVERQQDVAIGGIAGARERDAVAGIERSEEAQQKRAGGPVVTTTCAGSTVAP